MRLRKRIAVAKHIEVSPIQYLPEAEKNIVKQALKAIEKKKGLNYAPHAGEIQEEIDKLVK